jgi:platelet-activating factor acetylhydrolase
MLVLNSDPFTLWKDHFERLKGVVEAWEPNGRRVLTLGEYSDHDAIPAC